MTRGWVYDARMPPRSGRWIALATLALIGGLIALVITGSGLLRSDRQALDSRWTTLRAPLDARYSALRDAATVVDRVGSDRSVTGDISSTYRSWQLARQRKNPDVEVATANTLEGLGRRLEANVAASAKLRDNADVTSALAAYTQQTPPEPLTDAYDSAADRYAQHRTHIRARLAAALFGYDARPALRIA